MHRPPLYFFSGVSVWGHPYGEKALLQSTGWKTRCFSFYHVCPEISSNGSAKRMLTAADSLEEFLDGWRPGDPRKVFLDSGAFSYLRSGPPPTKSAVYAYLDRYLQFVSDFQSGPRAGALYAYVTFDYVRVPEEVYRITTEIARKGFKPVPVWHCTSDPVWLERYMEEGYGLIGLGLIGSREAKIRSDARRVMATALSLASRYNVGIHGLGVGSTDVFHFPWSSVDSAGWIKTACNGSVYTLDPVRKMVRRLQVSKKSKSPSGVLQLDQAARGDLELRCSRYGLQLQDIIEDTFARACFNIRVILEAVETEYTTSNRIWNTVL